MNLIDLTLLACALAHPSGYRAYHVLFQSSGCLEGCMMQVQPYLAPWPGEHPAFRVMRWRCAWPDQEDGKI